MLIVLDSPNRKLVADQASMGMVNCNVTVTYADHDGSTFVEGTTPSTLDGMNKIVILDSPASGVRRVIKSITFYNSDDMVHEVGMYLRATGGMDYPIVKIQLPPKGSWSSDDQSGVNVGALTNGDKGDIVVTDSGQQWTLKTVNANVGQFGSTTNIPVVTVNAKGLVTAVSTAAISIPPSSLNFTGEVTGNGSTGGNTALTITNKAVTYAKIQDVSDTNKLLGRSSLGAGSIEEITCTPVARNFLAALDAAAQRTVIGAGTVTGVSGTGTVNGLTLSGSGSSSVTLTLGGTLSNISLTSQVTGTLPVANGGTGVSTLPLNSVLIGNGANGVQSVAPGADNTVLTSQSGAWVAATVSGGGGAGTLTVTNGTGGAVTVGDVGVINASGQFVYQTTRASFGIWCVVLTAGNAGADITVARNGRVAVVKLTANCQVGDKLILSTTAGKAEPIAYEHYNMFAIALTANSNSSNGSCQVLLYTNSIVAPVASPDYLWYIRQAAMSRFRVTLTGVTSTSISFTPFTPNSTNGNTTTLMGLQGLGSAMLVNHVLWNVTKGGAQTGTNFFPTSNTNFAQVLNINHTTGVITTLSTPATWAVGDVITFLSPNTYIGAGAINDHGLLKIKNTSIIPAMTRSISIINTFYDGFYNGGNFLAVHANESFSASKEGVAYVVNNRKYNGGFTPSIPLVDRSFTYRINYRTDDVSPQPDYSTNQAYTFNYLGGCVVAAP